MAHSERRPAGLGGWLRGVVFILKAAGRYAWLSRVACLRDPARRSWGTGSSVPSRGAGDRLRDGVWGGDGTQAKEQAARERGRRAKVGTWGAGPAADALPAGVAPAGGWGAVEEA